VAGRPATASGIRVGFAKPLKSPLVQRGGFLPQAAGKRFQSTAFYDRQRSIPHSMAGVEITFCFSR